MIVTAFFLGLRHGFDADHIVAIDNVTRQLATNDKNSITTGLFFALGHSSIVLLLTLLIVFGVKVFQSQSASILHIGGIIGTLVSVTFLWVTGGINLASLIQLKHYQKSKTNLHPGCHGSTLLNRVFASVISLVDRPGKMYVVGFLFGLGFDTATEIGLLGLAASSAVSGEPIMFILALPVAFAIGMILIDSIDAALIGKAIEWSKIDSRRYFRYNVIIVAIVFISSMVIGLIELLSLLSLKSATFGLVILHFFEQNSPWIGGSIMGMIALIAGIVLLRRNKFIAVNIASENPGDHQ